MPTYTRTIDDVLETVRKAKERDRKCCLLIGAGCSVEAGVPLASGFVKLIQENWPAAHQRAKPPKGYPQCMAELALAERRDLIAKCVDGAKLNWGHIAIAQLMKHGFVDRVLTTNFDPLVVRACAMVGHFPAVYDFASSQVLKPADISGDAVFYLHGQRSGFVLMNTEKECQAHSKLLAPLFEDASQGRVWIVVGYSGENDPVFDHLANVKTFDNNLYWVGYKDNPPAAHVREKLLLEGKYAFHVPGFDADDFFVTVAQRLRCFPPPLIEKPFSFLNGLLDEFTEYKDPNQEAKSDVTEKPRELIRLAIEQYEATEPTKDERVPPPESLKLRVQAAYMAGEYDKVIAMLPKDEEIPPELIDDAAWAYLAQGNKISDAAAAATGAESDALFAQSFDCYAAALKIKPDMHEALYNWGTALADWARVKSGAEAERLFELAGEKYEAALGIKPDDQEALYNWGNALADWAEAKSGAERHRLIGEARKKWLEAEALSPGSGAYNLACASALQDREDECREWLEKSKAQGKLPSRQYLLEDSDLESIRGREWFQALIADLGE